MAEYIEREVLLQKQIGVVVYDEGGWDANVRAVQVEDIEAIPAADVEPVRHGRWETVPYREFDGFETVVRGKAERCTNCCRASKDFKKWFAICPNCGAKMDATDINVGDKEGG